MNIQCPKCQQFSEVAFEVAEGQHIRCPYCGVKFAYGRKCSVVLRENNMSGETKKRSSGKFVLSLVAWITALVLVSVLIFSFVDNWKVSNKISFMKEEIPTDKSGFEKNGWVVYENKGQGCERTICVLIHTSTKKEYLKDCFGKGFMIAIRPDDMLADLYYIDDKEVSEDMKFINMARYKLFKESEWNQFCEKICEFIKAKPAKDIISFVSKYK